MSADAAQNGCIVDEMTLESICRQYDDMPLFQELGYTFGDDTISCTYDWSADENLCFDLELFNQFDLNCDDPIATTAHVKEVSYLATSSDNSLCHESLPDNKFHSPIVSMEPIKLSLHETNNGHYNMQYDQSNVNHSNMEMSEPHSAHIYNSTYRTFLESLKKKIVDNELDMFCHICNYGFKSFPRLIRHMETKRHAIQIERFRMMKSKNDVMLPKYMDYFASAAISDDGLSAAAVEQTVTHQDIDIHREKNIQEILDSLIEEFGEGDDQLFMDIESSKYDIVDAQLLEPSILL